MAAYEDLTTGLAGKIWQKLTIVAREAKGTGGLSPVP
jgi:hypothetical protein